jgi:prepilin signal peptidase PulO-like enzyme (type II secretory pathway)
MRTKAHIGMKTEIPFAPFLIIGFLLSFFFGWDVLHLKELFTLLI